MPSNEEDNGRRHRSKVRRVERACDTCRRRKSRCDGSQIEGDTCSTCAENGLECTYLNAAAKRGPKRIHSRSVDPSGTKDYTEQLETRLNQTETRLEDAENLIRQLHAEAGQPRNPQWASLQVLRTALRALASPPPPPTADDLAYAEIAAQFEKLAVGSEVPPHSHYIGQSSGAQLISAAMELKLGCAEEIRWTRRERFWTFKPWEKVAPHTHTYTFPPADLLPALVAAYFTHVNVYLPLLHRPTFEVALARQQHLREDDFAATLLLVCAIGSRWADGAAQGDSEARLACGWEWYDQVPQGQSHLFGQASLYHLQYYSLSVVFLEGSCTPSAHWTLIGMGLRVAQDVGAHRRKQYVEKPSVEAELWKRAFWVLVYLDRAASSSMGRPCAIQYDDFDIDPPIECDDEYWEDPICPFEQPPGVPSKVTFFNYLLKLSHITAFSLRILYSLNKTKVQFGIDDTWEMQFVAELDSALNSWHDELPEHLQWDPARADPVFFDQSVALHCGYYHLQILNHRRFIPMVREAAPTALPSLAICTSAARACTGMVDVQRRRKGNVPVSFNLPAVFTSAIVLLLNVWSGKRTGLIPDPSREIANVHKCMEVVRVCEERWQSAGLLWDILAELVSVGRLPLPKAINDTPSQAGTGADPPHAEDATAEADSSTGAFNAQMTDMLQGLNQEFDAPESLAHAVGNGADSLHVNGFAAAMQTNVWSLPDLSGREAPSPLPDGMINLIDNDLIAMWTNAPTGFELEDWGAYLTSFSEITQGQQHVDATLNF